MTLVQQVMLCLSVVQLRSDTNPSAGSNGFGTLRSVGVSRGAFVHLTYGTAQLQALGKHWVLWELEILVLLTLKNLFTTFKMCKIQVPNSV